MRDVFVEEAAQMQHGDRRLLTDGRLEIGVFRIKNEFHAFLNACPHQGGPVCQGKIMPKVEEHLSKEQKSIQMSFSDDVFHIVCPWHGYEFKFETGAHPGSAAVAIRRFPTKVIEGRVYVTI